MAKSLTGIDMSSSATVIDTTSKTCPAYLQNMQAVEKIRSWADEQMNLVYKNSKSIFDDFTGTIITVNISGVHCIDDVEEDVEVFAGGLFLSPTQGATTRDYTVTLVGSTITVTLANAVTTETIVVRYPIVKAV